MAFSDHGVCFMNNPSNYMQGIGQGNGGGWAGWITLVRSPNLEMLRTLGFRLWVLLALVMWSLVYMMGFAFVNDMNLFHLGQEGQTSEDLIPEIQEEVN